MNQKVRIGIGLVFIACVVGIVSYILFSGNGEEIPSESKEISLAGTWRVYQYIGQNVDNEFMVFDEDNVDDYRDGVQEPYASSTYSYENGELSMPDISKEFTVRILTKNHIILVEPNSYEWRMIKVANGGEDIQDVTAADLMGEYDVTMVAGEPRDSETMTFTETDFTDVRDGKEYLSSKYEMLTSHIINAIGISKEFDVYQNGDALMLIDRVDGYAWELSEK